MVWLSSEEGGWKERLRREKEGLLAWGEEVKGKEEEEEGGGSVWVEGVARWTRGWL